MMRSGAKEKKKVFRVVTAVEMDQRQIRSCVAVGYVQH
jgi:hypothetical protein